MRFELLCKDVQNRRFLVKIQRIRKEYLKDNSIYFMNEHIQDRARKANQVFPDGDFRQNPTIFIGLLNFDLEDSRPDKFRYVLQMCDMEDKTGMYKRLRFVYLELPKFERLCGSDLLAKSDNLTKWLYAITRLHTLKRVPRFLREGAFCKLLEVAEIAKMTKEEKEKYESTLCNVADEYASNAISFRKGRTVKKIEIIKNLLLMRKFSITQIAKMTLADETYVREIKKEMEMENKAN